MQETKVIPTDLQAARSFAEEFLGKVAAKGFADGDLFAVRLALEEALINAIKHGNRSDPDKFITIAAEVNGEAIVITVTDQGGGFDPDHLPDPTADENLEKPCGRGIMLMRVYMDEVSFNDRGNQVRMVKQRG
ncbi:MAG TPA: ATP-binding protein [Phycisphaerae bacterium]|nr:ATP-binding protein [Phycisphaerae bacterium]